MHMRSPHSQVCSLTMDIVAGITHPLRLTDTINCVGVNIYYVLFILITDFSLDSKQQTTLHIIYFQKYIHMISYLKCLLISTLYAFHK